MAPLLAALLALASPPPSGARLPLLPLARTPYIGVSCPAANVTTCGRVGIAVWLAQRGAGEVVVTLGGTRARLGPPPARSPTPSWRTFVHLPLAAMGLPTHWDGEPFKALALRVRARYGRRWLGRTLVVPLSAGWG